MVLYRTIWLLFDSVHRLVCGSFTKDHNVSETGSVSVLRWMGQVDLLRWARQKELVSITGLVSETLWSFVKLPHTRRWTKSKRSQIVLYTSCVFCFLREWWTWYLCDSVHVRREICCRNVHPLQHRRAVLNKKCFGEESVMLHTAA
jgi:hypothetical protein